MAYYEGRGYPYIIGGEVTNEGTLIWQENGGESASLSNTFQFNSDIHYSDYLSLTVRCETDPVTSLIPPPVP